DGYSDIGAVVTVEHEWEFIRRLDTKYHRAGTPTRLARNERGFYAFLLQEMQNEIAHHVRANGRQQRRAQTQTARADADVRWASADVRCETLDLHEWSAHVIGVQING